MNIPEIAVKRPIATTMVFLIIIVVGIMGFRFLPVDLLPPIEFPRLSIRTSYPNVGPEEIVPSHGREAAMLRWSSRRERI
jgi:HAE1 family hydrophobic/amphiphilic exporter-1